MLSAYVIIKHLQNNNLYEANICIQYVKKSPTMPTEQLLNQTCLLTTQYTIFMAILKQREVVKNVIKLLLRETTVINQWPNCKQVKITYYSLIFEVQLLCYLRINFSLSDYFNLFVN